MKKNCTMSIGILQPFSLKCCRFLAKNLSKFGLPTISTPNILSRDISARPYHHQDISEHACFGPADVPAHKHFVYMGISSTWTFQHKAFSTEGHFATRNFLHHRHFGTVYFGTLTFQHMDIWALCKAIWTFCHIYFGTCATVPKCPCAEMFQC